ncbi:tautomerase family protein [Corynebacterium halotolerans]|uniref:tautomerase family protein n=1 Tax=Corynebacterium halotolerans TaxID=225326 RepID=UPI003CF9724E
MPTYTCWSHRGVLSPGDRERVATAVTEAHHEVARAPRYLVQVLFAEVEEGSHFIAGRSAPAGQVWIRGDVREGRTVEQRWELLLRLTGEVAEILGLPAELVWVYLNEIPGANMTEYGRVLPVVGEESEWFAALPADLQRRLRDLE